MKPLRALAFADAGPIDGRGKRSNQTLLRLSKRDHLLCEAARRFCAGMSDRAAGALLHARLARYRAGAWRRDRSEALCPQRLAGRLDAMMWMVLKVSDRLVSERLIRLVLSRSS